MSERGERLPWRRGAGAIAILAVVAAAAMWTRWVSSWEREESGLPERPGRAGERGPRAEVHEGDEGGRSIIGKRVAGERFGGPGRGREVALVDPLVVLARVNGAPIGLEQLVGAGPGGEAVGMEREIFDSRLERAIEAELVFQAARARGIGLTEAQRERLERIGPGHAANLEELKGYGVSWDTVTGEQADFERRLTEAMLLRQNLVASRDGVGPSPHRAAQARYEEALERMLRELKAGAEIEVVPAEVAEVK